MKITPCCKTRHWHPVNRVDIPNGILRCELCDKMFDVEDLIERERGDKMTDRDKQIDEIVDLIDAISNSSFKRDEMRQAIKDLIEQEHNEAFNEGVAYEASKGAGR